MGTSHPLGPESHLQPSKAQKRVAHSWLSPAPPQVARSCLEGMTCDLLSILLSAPPKPGAQQVHGNTLAVAVAVARSQLSLSKPGQGEQNWLQAICFIIPSTQLAPPV